MTPKPPIRIATISNNPNPDWVWIRDLMGPDFSVDGRKLEWAGFSTAPERRAASELGRRMFRKVPGLGRYRGARMLAQEARRRPFDLIVSHGPWTTAWTQFALGQANVRTSHLAFSFNFTDLPDGLRKAMMKRSFESVDAFAVFTDGEQDLYADWFGLDRERFIRAPWGVAPPLSEPPPRRMIEHDYVVALGGEARDYATLCETARLCPEMRFVAVARPHNFADLAPPDNLEVFFNLPFRDAWGIVWHARAALIPLRSRETACGLVTLVGGMHLGKAQVVTAAAGLLDYVEDGSTALLVPPRDAGAMAAAVRRLLADPALAARIGARAKAYAGAQCSEAATVAFFRDFLIRRFG
ncbi:MAG TPA: glycosyltransferase family 4 protein [Rhodocyclaceae bacterium]